jgi:hypothetical protein
MGKSKLGIVLELGPKRNFDLYFTYDIFCIFCLADGYRQGRSQSTLKLSLCHYCIHYCPLLCFCDAENYSRLHPGSGSEENMGPVMSGGGSMLNSDLLITFGLSFAAFTMLYFWILNITVRSKLIENKLLKRKMSNG